MITLPAKANPTLPLGRCNAIPSNLRRDKLRAREVIFEQNKKNALCQ
jgi:hypothetical protein